MSPIGKVFIVLNLVFSLVLLGVVGAILSKSDEYKMKYSDEVTSHGVTTKTLETEKANFEQMRNQLNGDIAKLGNDINQLTVTNTTQANAAKALEETNANLRKTLDQIQADYTKFNTTLADLRTQNENLQKAKDEAENTAHESTDKMRAAQAEQQRLEQEVATLTQDMTTLKAQIEELEAQKGDLSMQIQAAVQAGFDISKVRAVPQIDAVVESVNPEIGLVVLSVGADDGVFTGMKFSIYSNGRYKGDVVVDDVYPDNAAARIVKSGTMTGSDIAVNDKATTRL